MCNFSSCVGLERLCLMARFTQNTQKEQEHVKQGRAIQLNKHVWVTEREIKRHKRDRIHSDEKLNQDGTKEYE